MRMFASQHAFLLRVAADSIESLLKCHEIYDLPYSDVSLAARTLKS